MNYLYDEEFKQMFYDESIKKKDVFQIASVMFTVTFSTLLVIVVFYWDILLYDGVRLVVSLCTVFSLLSAFYTIYTTLIEPFNAAIEAWKKKQILKRDRALLDTSPLYDTSVNVSELETESGSGPFPILNLSRSPRSGRSGFVVTTQPVSSPEAVPVTVGNLPCSPRRLRPRPNTIVLQPQSLPKPWTPPTALNALVVPVEVHRADET